MITHYVSVKVVCVKVLELFSHQLQIAYFKKNKSKYSKFGECYKT